MQEKQKVSVQSRASIIGLGKSKRLAAMRQSIGACIDKQESQANKFGANKKESEIQQARAAIRQSITEIKAGYPKGMQNKLFALRYGSEEKINQMSLQKLFTLLSVKQRLSKEVAELEFQDKNIGA